MKIETRYFLEKTLPAIAYAFFMVVVAGIAKEGITLADSPESVLRLATTTSTVDSGLLDVLLPEFEKESGIRTNILSVGSGAALDLGRKGEADVVLTHSARLEDEFISEGYGINDVEVMYNDFVIVAPRADPAKLKGGRDVKKAFQKIYSNKALFISRGDNSGTNERERALWELAGLKPEGKWYRQSRAGMLKTLEIASQEKRYCLSDRGTYLSHNKELHLQIVVEGDNRLFNTYRVIAVNPAKVPGVNFRNAMAFVDFLKSASAKAIIEDYGLKKYGQRLFYPLIIKRLP